MSQLGRALTDPELDPPVKALVCWNSNPASIAPDQDRVLAGLRARGPVHRRARAVHDRHRAPRRRGAPRHHPARAPRRGLLLGPPLPDLERAGDRAASGEAMPNTEAFRLLAARLGLDDPCFRESDEEMVAAMLATSRRRGATAELRERGWVKVDLGQGRDAARRGRLRDTTEGARDAATLHRAATTRPAEVADAGAGGALPAGADHAEDPPLPQLDVREPEAPALGPAQPAVVHPSRTTRGRAESRTAPGCACTTTAATFSARARVRRRPARRGGGPDGLVERRLPGRAQQPGHHLPGAHRGRATPRSSTTTAWSAVEPGRPRPRSP